MTASLDDTAEPRRNVQVKSHSSYLAGLNPAQHAAVTFGMAGAEGACVTPPLLVIAGAGTGKTKTLATRVAHLILNGADPRRLLLLTFARRMASEMLRRVEHICAQALDSRTPAAAQAVEWSGTFHADRKSVVEGKSVDLGG